MWHLKSNGFSFVILLVTFSISSCEDFGGPPPRIIPGVSVEGVRLGDSRETVESVLGKPNGVGWVDGVWRTWRVYYYDRPERNSIIIEFIDNLDTYGPVDKINVKNGYSGTTREGIGIGSSRVFVERCWGNPRKTLDVYAVYCFDGKFATILYDGDTVSQFATGFFIPCPADTFQTCN